MKNDKLNGLRFAELRRNNVRRCEQVFHKLHEWSAAEWACAMAGETGEACNKIKKRLRGEHMSTEDIGAELADVVIYTDLLAARLGIDLGAAVTRKFNEVSRKRGATIFLLESLRRSPERRYRGKE